MTWPRRSVQSRLGKIMRGLFPTPTPVRIGTSIRKKGNTVLQTRRKPIRRRDSALVVLVVLVLNLTAWLAAPAFGADPWVVYKGSDGPGKGKQVVLVSGDEEYRSEEALPQLAKILATRHGFTCTVLFAIGKDGIDRPEPRRQHPRPRGTSARPT